MATIEVFKAQVAAHGWDWAQRDEFGFICFDRWLYRKGDYYYLTQGGHKGESIDTMVQIDRGYLEWIVDKCPTTDPQTKAIIEPYLGRVPVTHNPSPVTSSKPSSRGKKRSKGTISDADLSLFPE